MNYQAWPGNHRWWFNGKFVTGKRPIGLIATFTLINVSNLISFSQTWIPHSVQHKNIWPLLFGGFFYLTTITFLFLCACTDPGFIPRQPDDFHTTTHQFQFNHWYVRDGPPGNQSHMIRLKHCSTCAIMRPKRAIHCAECDTCVE